jgi:hypothetical protein
MGGDEADQMLQSNARTFGLRQDFWSDLPFNFRNDSTRRGDFSSYTLGTEAAAFACKVSDAKFVDSLDLPDLATWKTRLYDLVPSRGSHEAATGWSLCALGRHQSGILQAVYFLLLQIIAPLSMAVSVEGNRRVRV